jgi:hypothetical protein
MKLHARGWSDFQHYKDRSPPWIRLHRKLLDNKDFQRLPDASRALAPMLWLLCSESLDGSINADADDISFRLRQSEEWVQRALKPLIEKGFFELSTDGDSGVLADRLRDAVPETETETEKRQRESAVPAAPSPAHAPKQKRKSPTTPLPDGFGISERVTKWAAAKGHGSLDAHLESFLGKVKAKDYRYVDWDEAFMTAIRDDWAKLRDRRLAMQPSPDEAAAVGQRAAQMTRQLLEQQASVTQSPDVVKAGVEALKALQQKRLIA